MSCHCRAAASTRQRRDSGTKVARRHLQAYLMALSRALSFPVEVRAPRGFLPAHLHWCPAHLQVHQAALPRVLVAQIKKKSLQIKKQKLQIKKTFFFPEFRHQNWVCAYRRRNENDIKVEKKLHLNCTAIPPGPVLIPGRCYIGFGPVSHWFRDIGFGPVSQMPEASIKCLRPVAFVPEAGCVCA